MKLTKNISFWSICAFALLILHSCMSVSGSQDVIQASSTTAFNHKKISILPVKMQASLAPDSVMALRIEVNNRLAPALQAKIPSAIITDVPDVADRLNQTNRLTNFEQLISSYESTGIINKKQIIVLGQALGCDFLLLSRLKSEKMDIGFLSKGAGASLDVMLISVSGKIAWAGSGEWKKGGIFNQGGAGFDEIAKNIITLAFKNLQSSGGTPQNTAVASEKYERQVTIQEAKTINENEGNFRYVITRAQQKLVVLGYEPGPVDGIPGSKTKNALKKFQQDNGLPVTGNADQKTMDKLFDLSN